MNENSFFFYALEYYIQSRLYFHNSDLKYYKNQNVLVVTHGSLILLGENIIEEKNVSRKHIDNCYFVKYNKGLIDVC